jgi:NAD(P)-dependent dehydrogenase (short-subunit alcohol dehydrogenase family)
MSVEGRVALVTGATSGLGSEIARFLARDGAKTVVAGRDRPRGEAVVAEIEEAGGTAIFAPHDLRDRASAKELHDAAVAAFGRVDILVANAGTFFFGDFHEYSDEEFDVAIDVNLRGSFKLVQETIPGMMERKYGRVIFISSPAADFAVPNTALYGMTKSALNGLMRALVPEYGPFGVTFNVIQPGLTDTPLTSPMLSDSEMRNHYAEVSPNRRVGVPEDIAHATLMLADDLAGHISGASLVIDGGQTMTQNHTALPPPPEKL